MMDNRDMMPEEPFELGKTFPRLESERYRNRDRRS